MESPAKIAVFAASDGDDVAARARGIAEELRLPLAAGDREGHASSWPAERFDLLLAVTPERLELRETGTGRLGPVFAEFVAGRLGHRRGTAAFGAAMLARAVGFKKPPWRVADATAGLARDALLLACAGCEVTAIERSAVIAALVQDGLRRAGESADLAEIVRDRIRLIVGDAREYLSNLPPANRPDVVYLDPMFPTRKKSALVKKEMQICRRVAGDDSDAPELLEAALQVARARVTVKRPILAPPLRPDPAFAYKGKTIRYDVYLPISSQCARKGKSS